MPRQFKNKNTRKHKSNNSRQRLKKQITTHKKRMAKRKSRRSQTQRGRGGVDDDITQVELEKKYKTASIAITEFNNVKKEYDETLSQLKQTVFVVLGPTGPSTTTTHGDEDLRNLETTEANAKNTQDALSAKLADINSVLDSESSI